MPLHVLLIDDDEVDRQVIRRALQKAKLDAAVTEAATAANGLDALETAAFDCVLLDYRLPDVDGLELLRAIRQRQEKQIPVVMLTGVGDERTAVSAIRTGAQDYLVKGRISPDELRRSITAAIQLVASENDRRAAEKASKQALAAFRESERRFRELFETAVEGIYRTTPEGQYLEANPALARMHGCRTPREFMDHFRDIGRQIYVDPDARRILTERMQAEGSVQGFECRAYRLDGSQFWMRESGRALRDEDGRLLGYQGIVENITEQRQAAEALRESQKRFHSAFQTAPHGMALVAPDGRWLRVNRALCDMLGYEEEELLATDFQTITHPDDLDADLELVRRVLAGEISTYQMEKRYVCKNNQIIWILLSVSLVRDEGGAPLYFISQIIDLTERKKIAAQLLQAQKMQAVGQLTGGVAHDFNNLLTVILGNARLLERRLTDDAVASKQLAAISGAARRGADLTNRLLAFSRKEELEAQAVDAGELVTGMLDMLRRTIGEAIEIRTNFGEGELIVRTDPNLLEAALLNLSTNARDAMPDGGALTISVENATVQDAICRPKSPTASGEYVMLTVSDTGIGIPAEQIDRIFEPFFTTKEVGKGTGLGLSMAFGFAQQSGGFIRVESAVGQGTRIKLYLPKAEATEAKDWAQQGSELTQANGRETILVVEDEAEVRDIAVTLLEDLGYRVLQAESGPEALARLERQPGIDLLFTDIIMPGGMNGYELAETARARWPHLKVLYTSGYTDDAIPRSRTAEANAHIVRKPYHDLDLADRVKEALRPAH